MSSEKAVERANELNVPVPTLDTLVTQIEFLQQTYKICNKNRGAGKDGRDRLKSRKSCTVLARCNR